LQSRQSRQMGVSLPQRVPHDGGHDDVAAVRGLAKASRTLCPSSLRKQGPRVAATSALDHRTPAISDSCALLFEPSLAPGSLLSQGRRAKMRWRLALLPAYAGFRECCHPPVAGDGRFEDGNRERGAGGFAEAHAQIEERLLADALQKPRVSRFGRAMRDDAVVERVR